MDGMLGGLGGKNGKFGADGLSGLGVDGMGVDGMGVDGMGGLSAAEANARVRQNGFNNTSIISCQTYVLKRFDSYLYFYIGHKAASSLGVILPTPLACAQPLCHCYCLSRSRGGFSFHCLHEPRRCDC